MGSSFVQGAWPTESAVLVEKIVPFRMSGQYVGGIPTREVRASSRRSYGCLVGPKRAFHCEGVGNWRGARQGHPHPKFSKGKGNFHGRATAAQPRQKPSRRGRRAWRGQNRAVAPTAEGLIAAGRQFTVCPCCLKPRRRPCGVEAGDIDCQCKRAGNLARRHQIPVTNFAMMTMIAT